MSSEEFVTQSQFSKHTDELHEFKLQVFQRLTVAETQMTGVQDDVKAAAVAAKENRDKLQGLNEGFSEFRGEVNSHFKNSNKSFTVMISVATVIISGISLIPVFS